MKQISFDTYSNLIGFHDIKKGGVTLSLKGKKINWEIK